MTNSDNMIQDGLLDYIRQSRQIRQIHNFTKITSGWENEVYLFDAEYDIDGKRDYEELVLRIYQGENVAGKAQREFKAMKRLHELGFSVPKVYTLEIENPIFGNPFVIMEKINGQELGKVIDNASWDRKMELVNQFCKIFAHLHSLDWQSLNFPQLPYNPKEPYGYINNLLSLVQGYADRFPKSKPFQPVLDWLTDNYKSVPCERLSIVHWDYHPANLLLKDDGEAIVIDWTNVDIGDYRADLAWTLLLVSSYGNPEGRDIVLKDYENLAGHKAEGIEYYEVFALMRRMFHIYISMTIGADKLGMRAEAVEMMKSNSKHIEALCEFLREKTGITIPQMERITADLIG
jgi:aminoglycoside phosphotransferase (APT) family kinase protein